MIIDFVGAIATGLGLLGFILLLNRVTGRWMPRWVFPATVALGMIGYTVWAEYSWPTRTIDGSPQLVLASHNQQSVFYRPWTFIWPQTTRLVAVDQSQTHIHPQQPDLVLTQIVLIGRWEPIRVAGMALDCVRNARVDLAQGVELGADGTLEGANWRALEESDAVLVAACALGEEIRHERGDNS